MKKSFKKTTLIYFFISVILCIILFSGIIANATVKTTDLSATIDVWDFGATELLDDLITYNNLLTVDVINSMYDESIEKGSSANTFPKSFTVGDLVWTTSKTNNRLRTTNTELTRYDESSKISEIGDASDLNGCLYLNSSSNGGSFDITVEKDDVVTVYVKFDNADDEITFTDENGDSSSFSASVNGTQVVFVAPKAGTYTISDTSLTGKPRYYRITREHSQISEISGSITYPEDIPENALLKLTNDATGAEYTAPISGNTYLVGVPAYSKGMDYSLSIQDAKGYIIESESSVTVKGATTFDVDIKKVNLSTVSGSIKGLSEDKLALLDIKFNAVEEKVYEPEVSIKEDTYTVDLEHDVTYKVTASGVNDYNISLTEYTAPAKDTTLDIEFNTKPLYNINLDLDGLSDSEAAEAVINFTNLNEEGYSYSFTGTDNISLRDGTYSIEVLSLSRYAQKLTSNLTVDGKEVSKTIEFEQETNWDFSDPGFTSEKSTFGSYNGLLFDGVKKNKSYALGKEGTSIKVPVTEDCKVTVSYAYAASGTIGDVGFETSSGSTSTIETATYEYSGSEDYVDIKFSGDSYVTKIEVKPVFEYKEVITVGSGKKYDYKTINEALEAVSYMNRPKDERVTIKINPGNYEEMIVVKEPNISLVNMSANANTKLKNEGVDIAKNAVRITSYYGHGCYYYSMGNDGKYDEEVLKVNKENGYLSYENPGSGTTNESYWNATAVIYSKGFEADGIIFENSFNQYVSEKESNDIIDLASDNKGGKRSTTEGDTSVQDKSYVERAAALSLASGSDNAVFSNCKFVGRQDTLYGAKDCRVVFYECDVLGGTDYIFGGMIGVFYQCNLVMNTSDSSNDVCYITAAQQSEGRGYLMYECTITSTTPGKDTASKYRSKPGYFGRPWAGVTSEVVFYNTTIETTNYEGSEGQSLIVPEGWNSSLGGEAKCYEYGTVELAEDTDNSSNRVSWSTVLESASLPDGTEIKTENWLAGEDKWDPLTDLTKKDEHSIITRIRNFLDILLGLLSNS